MPRKIMVTVTEEQYALLRGLEGLMGSTVAEVLRNLALQALYEKSYVKDAFQKRSP
ncbi:MAG: hypothetical protein QW057_00975 [Candidatus Bathyarchaeia archaeon]